MFHFLNQILMKNWILCFAFIAGIAQHPMYDIIMDMLKNDPVERISSSQVVERISNIEWWQEQFIPPPRPP
jgi:hypothetical protein